MSKRRVDRHASEIGVGHTAGHVKMLEDADPASVEVDPKLAGQSLVDRCRPGARDAQDPNPLSPSWDMNLIPISTKTAARKPYDP